MKTTLALAAGLMTLSAFANTSVEATNKIGLKLAQAAAKNAVKEKNFMVSPLSLSQALVLAGNGTNSATRAELESLLGSDIATLSVDSKALVSGISASKEQNGPVTLSVNNSIWNTNGALDNAHFEFSPAFKKIAAESFNAEAFSVDFTKQSAVDSINGWADKKTYGLVKKIIELDTLQDMLWVIMNATYMETSWAQPFYKMGDNAPLFTGLDKIAKKVSMIKSQQNIAYAKVNGGEVATLAFTAGNNSPEIEMMIFLPEEGEALEKSQNAFFDAAFQKKAAALLAKNRALAEVVLPKFSFDTSVEMKDGDELTKAMGLQFLFEDSADFSVLQTPESLVSKVGLIRQNSRIELDEKGVKAAAVTIIGGIRATSVPPRPSMSLIVNRPFHFSLVEKKTGTVLFAGTVVEPK